VLETYENLLFQWIEEAIAHGTDDDLFATGYLQGHLSVVFSELEQENNTSLSLLEQKMSLCLNAARSELAPRDFTIVQDSWYNIFQFFEEKLPS
jgi:hypothetical protein